MELTSPQFTLAEARQRMLLWLKCGNKTESEMDQFLEAVSRDWLHYDQLSDGDLLRFSFMWKDDDGRGPRYGVNFMKNWNPEFPLRIQVHVDTLHMG